MITVSDLVGLLQGRVAHHQSLQIDVRYFNNCPVVTCTQCSKDEPTHAPIGRCDVCETRRSFSLCEACYWKRRERELLGEVAQ